MGGRATWETAIEQPSRFAALPPFAEAGTPPGGEVKGLPIWFFHGAMDEIVPISESTAMVEAVKKAGGNVRFTVYADVGHDAWTRTYENPELYGWFLSHCGKPGVECPEIDEECG